LNARPLRRSRLPAVQKNGRGGMGLYQQRQCLRQADRHRCKPASTAVSVSAVNGSDCHTARTLLSAPARSPSAISTRASAMRPRSQPTSAARAPRRLNLRRSHGHGARDTAGSLER
jgi:hypothetical protein